MQVQRTAICLAILLLVTGCGEPAVTWKPFHDANAGFSIDFPGKIETPPGEDKPGSGGPVSYHYFSVPGGGISYDVHVIIQDRTPAQIETLLKDVESRPWRPNEKEATFDTTRIHLGDMAGVEAVGRLDTPQFKQFKRWRTFSSPTAAYYISVEASKSSDPYGADVEKFFKSFKIDRAH